ncbi:MAG: hypothetical protein II243_02750 [Lachnospiraceae bacterium]|nr:hypothetical protein [Lachnospiraceae bacterium]MBQ1993366.1 hypothetical protein [Lachnospiraceae bacterium]MBQ2405424.1 hypothetical protein [Lachnospiraceae bacterium]MEE0918866.1 phage baseplate assembly protein V [Lachnospiraceae bacterium]
MGLFDVIDDITAKQITKTDTGDNRIFGLMIGIVVKNYDKDMPGRVCVNIPVRDENANTLKWAKMVMNSNGTKWGTYFVPEIGDQVVLGFEEGNIEKPYIIGCLATDNSKVVRESVDEDNQIKQIASKNGSHIKFVDNKEGEGEKDQIELQTAGKKHTVLLDNENKKILISDEKKKNYIELNTPQEEGSMTIQVEKSLTIKVGSNITVSMNADTGAVNIKCDKISIKASNSASISSDGNFKMSGSSFGIEAMSSFKAESSGTAQLKGATVQIG